MVAMCKAGGFSSPTLHASASRREAFAERHDLGLIPRASSETSLFPGEGPHCRSAISSKIRTPGASSVPATRAEWIGSGTRLQASRIGSSIHATVFG